MSLSPIRTYIKTRIEEQDSDFFENDAPFNEDLFPRSKAVRAYHIAYELGGNQDENGRLLIETGTGTVSLFFKGSPQSGQTLYDSAMDTSHDIKLRIANPKNWADTIKRVQVTSITPERLGNNDNIVRITMQFEFTLANCVL